MSDKPSIPIPGTSLDLGTRDIALIRQAVRKGWNVPQKLKDKVLVGLDKAADIAQDGDDIDNINRVRLLCDVAKTTGVLTAQEQADDHERIKQERAEKGLPNDSVSIINVAFPKVRKQVKNTAENP